MAQLRFILLSHNVHGRITLRHTRQDEKSQLQQGRLSKGQKQGINGKKSGRSENGSMKLKAIMILSAGLITHLLILFFPKFRDTRSSSGQAISHDMSRIKLKTRRSS